MRIAKIGTWLYDGTARQPVDIVALDYDFWFAIGEADGTVASEETAAPLGPDGCLYYVRFSHAGDLSTPTWVDSGGSATIDEAMASAQQRVPGPIDWE